MEFARSGTTSTTTMRNPKQSKTRTYRAATAPKKGTAASSAGAGGDGKRIHLLAFGGLLALLYVFFSVLTFSVTSGPWTSPPSLPFSQKPNAGSDFDGEAGMRDARISRPKIQFPGWSKPTLDPNTNTTNNEPEQKRAKDVKGQQEDDENLLNDIIDGSLHVAGQDSEEDDATEAANALLDHPSNQRSAGQEHAGENLQDFGRNHQPRPTLTAYIENIDQSQWDIKPLPVRNTTAQTLRAITFPQLNSCAKLPQQWPVNEHQGTPTDYDPFLPWIHDVFPTPDGQYIQFIAQNKRRCQTGTEKSEIKQYMQPQPALFQHVPIKRLTIDHTPRYRLSSYQEADQDALTARFICRFKPSMEETLSVHNVDYDYHTVRKGYKATFTKEGFDNHMIWTSQLLFRCPVPQHLQHIVKQGSSVQHDFATLFLDLVPIRTPPRYGYPNIFLQPKYGKPNTFIPDQEWGKNHILPKIEDSGRWENIPICKPSLMTYPQNTTPQQHNSNADNEPSHQSSLVLANNRTLPTKHRLIACTWTSKTFKTRGDRTHVADGERRLREWIQFNLLTGFDHIYVYDNTGAFSDTEDLSTVTDLFPPDKVTRIHWPSRICNNRPGNGDNKGERSSQYAAESSCRLRFGPHADWIGSFDIDEYLVPKGTHNSMTQIVDKMDDEGIKILSFKSKRSRPRLQYFNNGKPNDTGLCKRGCFDPAVPLDKTFLEVYNCDVEKPPRSNTMPAEKQLYRADYVLLHFVHYSTITTESILSESEAKELGVWRFSRYKEQAVRYVDEIDEATMLHTKSIVTEETSNWRNGCRLKKPNCKVGVPFPPGKDNSENTDVFVLRDDLGFTCNCYPHEKIDNYWVGKLEDALKKLGTISSSSPDSSSAISIH